MIIKENYNNISDGLLSYVKRNVKFKYSETSQLLSTALEKIIGPQQQHDSCVGDFNKHPTWLEISYGNKYIIPSYYTMQGRINEAHCFNQLRSWDLEGKTKDNKWILLKKHLNDSFALKMVKTFPIGSKEPIKAIRINMTEADDINQWWICIGHIDIYGYMISSYELYRTCKRISHHHAKFSYFILYLLSS